MDNPQKLATIGTHDIGHRTKTNTTQTTTIYMLDTTMRKQRQIT